MPADQVRRRPPARNSFFFRVLTHLRATSRLCGAFGGGGFFFVRSLLPFFNLAPAAIRASEIQHDLKDFIRHAISRSAIRLWSSAPCIVRWFYSQIGRGTWRFWP